MDCGDLRHTNQVRLPGQARMVRGSFVQARFQALPHLARGSAREGDNQHPVDADAALHNQPHDALHQHGGFAAARRGRYQQLAVVGTNSRFLRGGKTHAHRSFPDGDMRYCTVSAGRMQMFHVKRILGQMPDLSYFWINHLPLPPLSWYNTAVILKYFQSIQGGFICPLPRSMWNPSNKAS